MCVCLCFLCVLLMLDANVPVVIAVDVCHLRCALKRNNRNESIFITLALFKSMSIR